MKLCTCNNCGTVYEDMNPGDESIEYPERLRNEYQIEELPTIIHDGKDDPFDAGYIGYGCSECLTDGHLQDNINPYCGGMATLMSESPYVSRFITN